MIIVKIIAVVIGIFIILVAIIPNSYTVSVSNTIKRPKAEVLDYVKKFENQTKYSVWVMEDKNVKLKYAGVDGEVGVNQAWDSEVKNVGAGNQTLTALTDSRVDVDIHFDKPMKGDVKAATILETITDNETKITTEFYSTTPRPFSVMSYLIGKPIISKAMKQNLINIKSNLEK